MPMPQWNRLMVRAAQLRICKHSDLGSWRTKSLISGEQSSKYNASPPSQSCYRKAWRALLRDRTVGQRCPPNDGALPLYCALQKNQLSPPALAFYFSFFTSLCPFPLGCFLKTRGWGEGYCTVHCKHLPLSFTSMFDSDGFTSSPPSIWPFGLCPSSWLSSSN